MPLATTACCTLELHVGADSREWLVSYLKDLLSSKLAQTAAKDLSPPPPEVLECVRLTAFLRDEEMPSEAMRFHVAARKYLNMFRVEEA